MSREGGAPSVVTLPTPEAEKCPVDHKTRQLWLDQARQQQQQHPTPPTAMQAPITSLPANESCDSSQMDQRTTTPISAKSSAPSSLRLEREISSIPRALVETISPSVSLSKDAIPSNNEKEGGTSESGHWIYPSERMFFDAMRRKNYDPQAEDMRSIVPIHNAVNERAWKEILRWEKGWGSESCGGPRLVSFAGDSKKLTPKARINTLLGYTEPFDRHDWVVDRCGKKVEYVIDFYSGKDEGKVGKSLNFYLDVRPKLNTLEGWKMRAWSGLGLS